MEIIYPAVIRFPTEKAHGIQIAKTVEALAALGHSVTLIIPDRQNEIVADPVVFYGLKQAILVKKVWCVDLFKLGLKHSIGYAVLTLTFVWSLLLTLSLKHNSSRIYYTRDWFVALVLSFFTAQVHYEIHTIPSRVRWWHRAAWRRSRGIVAISEGLKQVLVAEGVAHDKILIAHDGVDLSEFVSTLNQRECRHQLNLPVNKKIVVYLGQLYAWKGAPILAEASKQLVDLKDVLVCIVGGSALEVADFKSRWPHDTLCLPGRQSRDLAPLWLGAADVLVVPNSAKDKMASIFTSPLKLFEYLAVGKPIIASDVPALRAVLKEGVATWVNPDDAIELAAGIKKVLGGYTEAARRAQLGQELVKEYSWEKRAQKISLFLQRSIVC